MMRAVVDASVAAKWCMPATRETLVQQAENLLVSYLSGEIEFFVPDLFWIELANVLWKAVSRNEIDSNRAERAYLKVWEMDIPTLPSSETVSRALQLAVLNRRSVYESVYVALALACQAELITADERLANALAARFPVKWLGAF